MNYTHRSICDLIVSKLSKEELEALELILDDEITADFNYNLGCAVSDRLEEL